MRINWASWSQQRRDTTLKRIEQHRDDAQQFNQSKESNESLLLFAYAQPDVLDTTDFVISSADDYCILAVQQGWHPVWKKPARPRARGTSRGGRR